MLQPTDAAGVRLLREAARPPAARHPELRRFWNDLSAQDAGRSSNIWTATTTAAAATMYRHFTAHMSHTLCFRGVFSCVHFRVVKETSDIIEIPDKTDSYTVGCPPVAL